MALTPALIITGIAIALLVVYGADVVVGLSSDSGEGFIPFDHKIRGMAIGGPTLILPFIAYFISRKEPSKGLGGLIIIAGILIIVGGAVVIGNADPVEAEESGRDVMSKAADGTGFHAIRNIRAEESGRDVMSKAAPLIVVGAIQIGLGVLKIKKS